MKLNEKEKQALINLLKKDYERTQQMLDNADYDWLKDEQSRKNVIENNNRTKENLEYLENTEGEVEIDCSLDNFEPHNEWDWVWIIVLIAFWGNHFGDNNSTDNEE